MAHDQPGKPNTKALLNGRFMFPYKNLGNYDFEIITFEVLLEAAKFDVISNNCNLSCFFYITTQMLRNNF